MCALKRYFPGLRLSLGYQSTRNSVTWHTKVGNVRWRVACRLYTVHKVTRNYVRNEQNFRGWLVCPCFCFDDGDPSLQFYYSEHNKPGLTTVRKLKVFHKSTLSSGRVSGSDLVCSVSSRLCFLPTFTSYNCRLPTIDG